MQRFSSKISIFAAEASEGSNPSYPCHALSDSTASHFAFSTFTPEEV
jgi:hypothetical protein